MRRKNIRTYRAGLFLAAAILFLGHTQMLQAEEISETEELEIEEIEKIEETEPTEEEESDPVEEYSLDASETVMSLIAEKSQNESYVNIILRNVRVQGQIKKIEFAVWSEKNGQDDLKWYPAAETTAGWEYQVQTKTHKTEGRYQVHAYVTMQDGTKTFLCRTSYEIDGASADTITVKEKNSDNGTFLLEISGIQASAGIDKVSFAVWPSKNKEYIKWYQLTGKEGQNTYSTWADVKNHGSLYGDYTVHVYVTDKNGIQKYVGCTSLNLEKPEFRMQAQEVPGSSNYQITAAGLSYDTGIKSVKFAVWSLTNGQDDLIWYEGAKQADGTWKAAVDIAKHKTTGTYAVHLYAYLTDGRSVFAGSTSFRVAAPSISKVAVKNQNLKEGTFEIQVDGASSSGGVSEVRAAVWSTKDQSNLKWYIIKNPGAACTFHVDIGSHAVRYETYNVHIYVLGKNGIFQKAGATTADMNLDLSGGTVTVHVNEDQSSIQASCSGWTDYKYIKRVQVPVWTAKNNQDDIRWEEAARGKDGWSTDIAIADHNRETGIYHIHFYAVTTSGIKYCIGKTSQEIEDIKAERVRITAQDEKAGTFRACVEGITGPAAIKKVEFAIWCTLGDQDDLRWYEGTRSGNRWYASADALLHQGQAGTYQVHVYVTDTRGVKTCVGRTSLQVPAAEQKSGYTITQYASVIGGQSMFYTIENTAGELIIIDGGYVQDENQVREVIAAHGNKVKAWFLTHPHQDHIGAFNKIYGNLKGIQIEAVYVTDLDYDVYKANIHSEDDFAMYERFLELTANDKKVTALSGGETFHILGLQFDILYGYNEATERLSNNVCNDASLLIKVSGTKDSMLFCGDLTWRMNDYLLETLGDQLKADYLQVSHHGNGGLRENFYKKVSPKTAFFDAPQWLMDNKDAVTGAPSTYTTPQTIQWMENMGVNIYSFSSAPNRIRLY